MNYEKVKLNPDEEYIRLDDALKTSGCFQTGGQAKIAIQDGLVRLNGEVCTMRGKKLRKGDKAEYDNTILEVC